MVSEDRITEFKTEAQAHLAQNEKYLNLMKSELDGIRQDRERSQNELDVIKSECKARLEMAKSLSKVAATIWPPIAYYDLTEDDMTDTEENQNGLIFSILNK